MSKSRNLRGRPTGRFAERAKRIARRDERNRFSFIVAPAIWLLGVLGIVALCAVSLHRVVGGEADGLLWSMAALPLLAALLLVVFRLVRGHFDGDLDEP